MSNSPQNPSVSQQPLENADSNQRPLLGSQQTSLYEVPPSRTRQPRLTSPRLFRDFFVTPTSNFSSRTLPPSQFRDPVQDVSRALASATQAVQNASHALEPTSFIDLTAESSLSQSPESVSLAQSRRLPRISTTQRPNTGRNRLIDVVQNIRQRQSTRVGNMPHPPHSNHRHQPNFLHPIIDYSLHLPELRPTTAEEIRREESRAIQRQRHARRLWEQNQQGRDRQRQSVPVQQSGPQISSSPKSSSPSSSTHDIESVDLTQVEDDSSLATALSKQRQDAISSQKQKSDATNGRSALTSYKCPVCMETPKDATTTVCGHLFCHKCIIETLKWSEDQRSMEAGKKTLGVCPVCRKPLSRKDGNIVHRALVPVEIKLMTKKRKRSEKGKERARYESEGEDDAEKENRVMKKEQATEAKMWNELTVL